MPDQASSFEQFLETDIKRLAGEVQKHRESPEVKNFSEKELLKHAIRSMPPEEEKIPIDTSDDSSSPLPAYAQNESDEVKLEIEYLLDIAIHKGAAKALKESKKAPFFVQDALHDALVGKFYPEMKKRGIFS